MSEATNPLGGRGRGPWVRCREHGPRAEGALTASRPLSRVAVGHAASILASPWPRNTAPQGPTAGLCGSSSAGLAGMQSGEGPCSARRPGLAVHVWGSGAAQGPWGPWG